ncbi:MAG: PilZ domain-containing protein [Nitrospirota bacterium]|nr:PilZ domain-containing protein [Nitrospirota bacterium]
MFAKKKALVICKSTSGRLCLGMLLSRIAYDPILTRSVYDALLHLEEEAACIIILDGDTPEEERSETFSLLKTATVSRELPIVAVLSEVDDSLSMHLSASGCAAIITKPVDISLAYGVLGKLSGEPRKTPRVQVRIRVEIAEGAPAPSLFSVNISEGGIYLRTPHPLPEDTVLHLSFTLPYDQEKITVAGKVVRTTLLGANLNEEPGMGISFVEIADEIITRIRNFVTLSLSSDLEWERAI